MKPTKFANGFEGPYVRAIKDTAATTYTFVADDAESYVRFTAAGAVTATVPNDASTVPALDIGKSIVLEQHGAGQVTIAADTHVTLHSAGALVKTNAQYSVVTLQKTAANEWTMYGDRA
jgi:hypothetical protein